MNGTEQYHMVSYKNASMYQKQQDTTLSRSRAQVRNSEDYSGINKIIEEEIFSKSIEFEPAWIGTIVLQFTLGDWNLVRDGT